MTPRASSKLRSKRVVRALPLAVLVALLLAVAPAGAYVQHWGPVVNDIEQNCTDTATYPCIEWAKTANNLSINVDYYLSYTLGQEELDLRPAIRAATLQWNGVAARNPHLQETTSTSNEEVWVTVDASAFPSPCFFAVTTTPSSPTQPYHINSSVVKFNPTILWNDSYNYTFDPSDCIPNNADIRKVSTHEFGHVEGLGHANPFDATQYSVMRQGAVTPWWARVDDHNGIIHIYGAYP